MKKCKMYMMVTTDKYRLPLYVADTPRELARIVGTDRNVVNSAISHRRKNSRFIAVEYELEDGEE